MAAKFGRKAAVEVLLKRGADPALVNAEYNETPLHNVAKIGKTDIFEMLLSRGANIDAVANIGDFSGGTPLHFAALLANSVGAVQYLLDKGANPNAVNLFSQSPLHHAVENQNLLVIKLLIGRGASLQQRDSWGNSVLHVAVLRSEPFPVVTRYLIDQGADVNAENADGRTPLQLAIRQGRFDLIRMLIESGAFFDVNKNNYLNATNADKVKALLQHRTDHTPLSYGLHRASRFTAIHRAAGMGNVDEVKTILSKTNNAAASFINNETLDSYNRTALHTAAHFGHLAIAKILLDNGANPNIGDAEGATFTPLHLASNAGNLEVVKLLVERGADVNAASYLGTPIVAASDRANAFISVVRYFLDETRATVLGQDSGYQQPIHHAIVNQNIEMAELLLKHGASLNAKAYDQVAPISKLLLSSCCYPQIPVLGWLIDNGADVNIRDVRGYSPLHYAVLGIKRKEVFEYLLYRGADPNALDSSGCNSPLYLLVQHATQGITQGSVNMMPRNGTAEVVQVLLRYGANASAVDHCGQMTALEMLENSRISDRFNPNLANVLRKAVYKTTTGGI